MIRRLLGRMGLSGYIPGANDLGFNGSNNTDAPDAPLGEAHITYLGGAKTPYSTEEAAARQELGDIVEGDLVWPGKPTTIGMRNDEPLAYRYNLTITNLPASHYVILPPTGGARQPEGGVLLQPGEETIFEVRFPPIAREHQPPQSFHFVLTRFDPRRRDDPGVVVGEDAARWVPLPSGEDFALRANVSELRLRPWRRNAKFLLALEDRSFLPSAAQLHILRAPTRQALTEHAEQVETISQSLEARTSGKWSCDLPPTQLRTSCWVTVRGAIRAGEHQNAPVQNVSVALPKPIYVRYTPWLRMGRDWAFLGGIAFILMWAIWGVPVYKSPVVHLTLDLPKGLPAGSSPKDFNVILTPIASREKSVTGEWDDDKFVFRFPGHWYGWRWPFGWNRWGRENMRFSVGFNVKDTDDTLKYSPIIRLGKKIKPEEKGDEFHVKWNERSPSWGNWDINCKGTFPLQKPEPRIYAFVPSAVQEGQVFTIDGVDFGKQPGKILFNGARTPAAIQSWSDEAIKVKAPVGAQPGMMQIQVVSRDNEKSSEPMQLAITRPTDMPASATATTSPLNGSPSHGTGLSPSSTPALPAQHPETPGGKTTPGSKQNSNIGKANGQENNAGSGSAPPAETLPRPDDRGGSPKLTPPEDKGDSSGNVPEAPPLNSTHSGSTPGASSGSPNPVNNVASVTTVTADIKDTNVIVPFTAKTIAFYGNNLGTRGKASLYMDGDAKTDLRVQHWKQDVVEIEKPRNATPGFHTLDLTSDKVPVGRVLYFVPDIQRSDYTENNRGGARDEKEINSLLAQGDTNLATGSSDALRKAEDQYSKILQVGHTAEDAARARYKLAQCAQSLYLIDKKDAYLARAKQEAWLAALNVSQLDDSKAKIDLRKDICHLLDDLYTPVSETQGTPSHQGNTRHSRRRHLG